MIESQKIPHPIAGSHFKSHHGSSTVAEAAAAVPGPPGISVDEASISSTWSSRSRKSCYRRGAGNLRSTGVGVHLAQNGSVLSALAAIPDQVHPPSLDGTKGLETHLALATGEGDVDETAGVCESLLGAALTIRVAIVVSQTGPVVARTSMPDRDARVGPRVGTYGVFFFSCLSTLGVCDLTFPTRASQNPSLPGDSTPDIGFGHSGSRWCFRLDCRRGREPSRR